MKNLKRGDKLRVIDNTHYQEKVNIGDILTFDRYNSSGDGCYIEEGDSKDIIGYMYLYRFELIPSQTLEQDLELARTFLNKEVVSINAKSTFIVNKIKIYLKEDDEHYKSSVTVKREVEKNGYCVALIGNTYHIPVSDAMKPPISKTVKLNDTYDAVVTKTEVRVGCQTFTIDKLHELLEAFETL